MRSKNPRGSFETDGKQLCGGHALCVLYEKIPADILANLGKPQFVATRGTNKNAVWERGSCQGLLLVTQRVDSPKNAGEGMKLLTSSTFGTFLVLRQAVLQKVVVNSDGQNRRFFLKSTPREQQEQTNCKKLLKDKTIKY